MLSLEDCLALCELTEEEVLAIAHHEHIPEIAATQLGNYLVRTPEGERRIMSIIRDDIAEAHGIGDRARGFDIRRRPPLGQRAPMATSPSTQRY